MQKRTSWIAVTLAAMLVLGAATCYPVLPTRFMILEAIMRGGEIQFASPQLEGRCPSGVIVRGISIVRLRCERDCDQWELAKTRRGMADTPIDELTLTRLPIRYGQDLPYTRVIHGAKPLTPGVYSAGAVMDCPIRGEVIGQTVLGRFELPPAGGEIRNILGSQEP